PRRPAHDLEALAVAARQVRIHVEVGHFRRDAHGVARRVKTANGADAAVPVDTRGPESLLADAVGGDHAQARNRYSAHGLSPRDRRRRALSLVQPFQSSHTVYFNYVAGKEAMA